MAGCAAMSPAAVKPTHTIVSDLVGVAPTTLPSPTAFLPNSQENQIVIACNQPGVVRQFKLQSKAMNDTLLFSVYFPPCFGNGVQDSYPALYLLHGVTFDNTQWQRLGITSLADQFVQNDKTVPFLIIMPYEQYYYRPADNNKFPVALVNELLPYVENNLHAKSEKNWRAIGGISRGASWAVRLGLQHWDLFGAIGAHSLPTFNDDLEKLPQWLEIIPPDQMPRIYLDIGSLDPAIKNAKRFEAILSEMDIPHAWHLNEGRHNEEYWQAHVGEYLGWYIIPWQILPSP